MKKCTGFLVDLVSGSRLVTFFVEVHLDYRLQECALLRTQTADRFCASGSYLDEHARGPQPLVILCTDLPGRGGRTTPIMHLLSREHVT